MNWFRFYHEALDDPKVQRLPGDTYKAWVNLLCLASRSGRRGYLPSAEDIGFALRVSTDQAVAIIDDLKSRQLIDETEGGLMPHNWPERQRVSDSSAPRVAKFRAKQQEKQDGNEPSNVTGNVTDESVKRDSNDLEQNRVDQSREEESSSTADGGDDDDGKDDLTYSPEFLTFWAAYPKKAGKGAAYKRWNQIKPSKALRDKILAAVEAQKHSRKWREGFIMDPSRWLNERHWDDEVEGNPPGTLTMLDPKPKTEREYMTQHLLDEVKRIRRDRANAREDTVIWSYDQQLAEVQAQLAALGVNSEVA